VRCLSQCFLQSSDRYVLYLSVCTCRGPGYSPYQRAQTATRTPIAICSGYIRVRAWSPGRFGRIVTKAQALGVPVVALDTEFCLDCMSTTRTRRLFQCSHLVKANIPCISFVIFLRVA
jgi:hypothetical protein